MSIYEMLSIVLATLACIVSVIVWISQKKLQRESNELQKATSELSRKQLEIIAREEINSEKAFLNLELIKLNNSHKFQISNISTVDAIDIEMELMLDNPSDNPIPKGEYESKFPWKKLSPGQSIKLIAGLHAGSPSSFKILLKWTNPDGARVEDERYIGVG
ncbi:6TM ABC transporter family protein [Legionella septentrionalis]|uniref:hypothetical protein n=1 Tax=Legionella septentrionalis TaxID=2498109 RepID=UPI000F8D3235|nr:hypothetical protein [Legionella septentrionalis]RUR14049.1 hypothetical protein ELY10_09545 [Legionella septentrionalis]